MRRHSRWALTVMVVALVVLHFVLRIGLGFGRLAPDLLVVALLLAAREMRAGWAAGLGLLLGILDGAVLPETFGMSALALTILGFLGARSRDLVAGESPLFLALYLFVGKWFFDILMYLFSGALFRGLAADLILVSPLAALYAAAAGLIVSALYRALD